MEIERIEAERVAMYPEVVVVSSQYRVQRFEQVWKSAMTVIPAPLREAFLGISERLAGRPPFYVRFAFAVFPPPKLEAQKVEGGFPRCDVRTERNYLRFLCGQLQPKLTQAFPQNLEETFGVFFLLEDADEVVCKSYQPRFPFAVRDDHF